MSDALDRLKRKKRPKVQPRTTRVDQESKDIQISRHIDSQKSEPSDRAKLEDISNHGGKDIQIPRHIDIKVSRSPLHSSDEGVEELTVKRSTFRLEVGLIGRMQRLCQDRKISREVMIESMFEYMERNPEALDEVLNVAESKNAYRQQLANRKRAKAMIEKFGQ